MLGQRTPPSSELPPADTTRCVRNHCWRAPTLTHVCGHPHRADGPSSAMRAAALTAMLPVLMALVPSIAAGRLKVARLARVAAHVGALSGIVATAVCAKDSTCIPVCVSTPIFHKALHTALEVRRTPGVQHETETTAHTRSSQRPQACAAGGTLTGARGRRPCRAKSRLVGSHRERQDCRRCWCAHPQRVGVSANAAA